MTREGKDTAIYTAFDDYVPHDASRPERDLLRAILLNAIADLERQGEVGRQARDYLLSTDEDYVFSFRSICSYLDIDPLKILVFKGLVPSIFNSENSH